MKRLLTGLLVMVIITGSLFAAGKAEEPKSVPTLEIWAVEAAEISLDTDNLPVWEEVENRTGVELSWEMVGTAVKDEKFNLTLLSTDLPDVMAFYEGKKGHTSINKFGEEGAFVALEDLINEHAPNLKRVLLDNPLIKEQITAQDGNIYFIPMMAAIKAARGWFVRYDWLDKLGLEVPTTTDELYDVLVAFRDGDPNGNGLADEVPLVFRRRGDDAFYNLGAFAYAFDADPGWVARNGKVSFGPSEKAYENYLAYISKLYGEKLIDQEILTRSGNARNELFGLNTAGAIHDWFASTSGLNDKLTESIPGFNLRHIAPPVGTAKKPYTRIQMSTVRGDGGWSITTSNKFPVETIKMMDFLYSEEGMRLTNFGIEGTHYTMKNGSPVYTDLIMNNPEGLGMHESLVTIGAQWKVGMVQHEDYEAQFANTIAFAARKDYQDNYIIEEFPVLNFTEAENVVIMDKFSQIRAYAAEMTARCMVGEFTPSEYTALFAEMNNMALAEVTKIYQAAYNRKMK